MFWSPNLEMVLYVGFLNLQINYFPAINLFIDLGGAMFGFS